ncbi:hypothetical protein Scep_025051 [Stephania cephalantha]|uniref:RBR-type E3 ubiquitin transferase n=1 Tax=Stephania cephalantha TaxID=152367 RepID=A0AAP0EYY5_9MAGN
MGHSRGSLSALAIGVPCDPHRSEYRIAPPGPQNAFQVDLLLRRRRRRRHGGCGWPGEEAGGDNWRQRRRLWAEAAVMPIVLFVGVFCITECSGCKAVRYCSITCQSEHWKAEHKLKCEGFARNSRKNLASGARSTTFPRNKMLNVAKRIRKVPPSLVPVTTTRESSNSKDSSFVCEICDETKSLMESFDIKGCSHFFVPCVVKFVVSKIQENITLIHCPEPGCLGVFEPQFCRSILPLEVFDRWADALCEAFILGIQRYYCPYKDCSARLEYDEGMVIRISECPHCHRLFCAQCKVPWHLGIECEDFQKLNKDEREREDVMLLNLARQNKWQRCPLCRFYVERTEGCSFMKCRCGHTFCYGCASPLNDHFCLKCWR